MKKFLIILVSLFIISSLLAAWWMARTWKKINFKLSVKNIDFGGITIQDIAAIALLGQTKDRKITLGADITNDNNFSIPFRILKAKLLYEGTLIGETSEELAKQKFEVPANQTLSISDTVNVILSKDSVKLLTQGVSKQQPVIDYVIKIKLLKIPFPFTIRKNFVWE